MAEIRKIVPRQSLSDFRQMVAPGPNAFDVLSGMAQAAYDFLEPAAIEEMKRRGTAEGMRAAGGGSSITMSTSGGAPTATPAPVDPNSPEGIASDTMAALGKGDPTLDLIRGFEGFRETPYWDVNALRTGYGSDTVTLADGTVQRVTDSTRVTREDAERDLARRVSTEFQPIAIAAVGRDRWDAMTPGQKAALSSIAYNYGEIPSRITEAVRSGDAQAGAAAIAALGGDNSGINRDRRAKEAALYAGGPLPSSTGVSASTMGGDAVMVRTSSGKVEPRLFSPLSGPILQAHNAAAGVAYISEKMVQGQTDLIGMANEFALNPQGFQQAAEAYIGQMVDDAPEMFRTDLQGELRSQAQRTFLGIVEDQQRDTRERAANSSAALVERWSSDYADALASGNVDAAAAAEAKLRGVLRTRETLPGLSWTPEQSENVILEAKASAEKAVSAARKETENGWKDQLNTIIAAAMKGKIAANEDMLLDPNVVAALPELVREATGYTVLRDMLPSVLTAPPGAAKQFIAGLDSEPITEKWQLDMIDSAKSAVAANEKALLEDPVQWQQDMLLDDPPPPLPELDIANPEAFLTALPAALAARVANAHKMVEAGYTESPVYISDTEAKALGAMFGKDVSPDVKAMAAGAVVKAMGPDAAGFFNQIGTDDPVVSYIGGLMAAGGSERIAAEAMFGQSLLDSKDAEAPTQDAFLTGIPAPMKEAIMSSMGGVTALKEMGATARALYAARAPMGADEETQKEFMTEAWQDAIGRQKKLGKTYGGVQSVAGQSVLIPPTMTGEDMNRALGLAFGTSGLGGDSMMGRVGLAYATKSGGMASVMGTAMNADMWTAAAGGVPSLGGEPIDPSLFASGEIKITAIGGSSYLLTHTRNGIEQDIRVLGGDPTVPFVFDAEKLIEAMRAK